ncbi:hypothetical protein AAG906_004410 [Vitis piasezkii]
MVSTLSGGRVTGRTILRRELPPRMLLIDLRRGAILDALYRIFEGFYFGPHHLVMVLLPILRRRCIGSAYAELVLFHSYFRG